MSPIGLRVGPFEIIEEATVPAHGSWYRARRAGLSRREPRSVLVRLLGPQPSARDLGQAQRQFEVLRGLDDPRFPRAVALYEGSGALAIEAPHTAPIARVVEARLLDDVTMTPATLIDLALDLTEALQAAHQRGHHHGHLSADNVALASDGGVWIWGLGLEGERPAFSWLPPERARGDRPSAATDQWSLGALLVALVSGHCPWSSSSASADPRTGDLADFIEPVAIQWPALGRLVRRMLDPNPTQRFPSLHPVRLELLALARRAGGVSDRRDLAAWLHHTFALENGLPTFAGHEAPIHEELSDEPLQIEILDDEDSEEVLAAPPAPPSTDTPVGPSRVSVRVSSAQRSPPASLDAGPAAPVVQAATRAEAPTSPRVQVRARLPREELAVVRPSVDANSVPDLGREDSEDLITEFSEEAETEMVPDRETERVAPRESTDDIPPIRRRIGTFDARTEPVAPARAVAPARSVPPRPIAIQLTDEHPAALPDAEEPEPLSPSASTRPRWRDEPAPTLPGMEAPEPAALSVTPSAPTAEVEVEFEDEDPEAAFFGEDVEIELLHDEDQTGPVWDARRVPTSIQPFTDPHFSSASMAESPEPAPARLKGPQPEIELHPDVDEDGPTLIGAPLSGPRPMPWEREPEVDLPVPANDPIVRLAPWAATAAMTGLVLLTLINVVRVW
ncbi:MAG: hypothetical protein EA397_02810 [Deltaproteobacteria bacterium]|nr:MAG: hypothetical protein EA397_02810 [Deltaproteobacteria bacterium]